MSTVLLRRILTAEYGNDDSQSVTLYPLLSLQTKLTLKSSLVESVSRESVKYIAKKLCDTVSELATVALPETEWPELLLFMF
ncbi:putative armadillo-like helical, importin beta family [Helianthus annuus]|uniref:Armadillo-like helical, importin beta family n=1 Tax=Helianthus annuus TaxID=4232 RepID=A0A9K3EGD1_HELAN|nr:putative armadillo-like helical, importin beta family [Helianthus annuus]KAJ0480928.1 putative armadillo-like helical, importin beta family [Helianthus annuus]KAJ0848936.1 putative armadillo-like helical, importin beta family [Helianthus annuus]KAJ0857950.1 putative armadillo-like helical, importin beta family [Helianthus annuus]